MVQLDDELLTVAEAAKLLKVTRHTIYRWVAEGRLPAVRYSPRVLRLRREDLARLTEHDGENRAKESAETWAERLAPVIGSITKEEGEFLRKVIREAKTTSPPVDL
jgi:excisionase family DNA binding protein